MMTPERSDLSFDVGAVLFDLDDTLFLQRQFLDGAWAAVADAAGRFGIDPVRMERALVAIAAEGSDRGRIIDRALAVVDGAADVGALVDVFRKSCPPQMHCLPGVRTGLRRLRDVVPVGVVTDGDPGIQRAKLTALRLTDAFDIVVLSDELGREHRKPDPAPFLAAASALDVPAERTVFVGDRPDKDGTGAHAAGMTHIRVTTGEYSSAPDAVPPWRTFSDVGGALAWLSATIRPRHERQRAALLT